MFTVSASKSTGSFWARNQSLINDLFKAGAIIIGLKLVKAAIDKSDLWFSDLHTFVESFTISTIKRSLICPQKICIFLTMASLSIDTTDEHSTPNYSHSTLFLHSPGWVAIFPALRTVPNSERLNKFHNYKKIHTQNLMVLGLFQG